jgi:putative YphP/YqiW family bacilliredoxin
MEFSLLMQSFRDEVTRLGVQELRTPEEVDAVLTNTPGTVLVFVNSVCGCAGGIARPALAQALKHKTLPEKLTTVFASGDQVATARARGYFTGMPPSSPSVALLRDRKLLYMIHRYQIETSSPAGVAAMLIEAFDKYCGDDVAKQMSAGR